MATVYLVGQKTPAGLQPLQDWVGYPCSWVKHISSWFVMCARSNSPNTHFMINISVQENWVVLTLNTCLGWSVMVSLGRFLTPSKRSEALTTSKPRKMVKETAWATNFMKGLRRIWPIWETMEIKDLFCCVICVIKADHFRWAIIHT